MPGKKTSEELRQTQNNNTLHRPQKSYEELTKALIDLADPNYFDREFRELWRLFDRKTFLYGENLQSRGDRYGFKNQGELRPAMERLISELTEETNEAENELDIFISAEGSSAEDTNDIEDKYNEIKAYYNKIKDQTGAYIAGHPAVEPDPKEKDPGVKRKTEFKKNRLDTVKERQQYVEAMLHNIDLKLQMRKDAEAVEREVRNLKRNPQNADKSLDAIIEIEAAYPENSMMHQRIKKIFSENLMQHQISGPFAEKYNAIGNPAAVTDNAVNTDIPQTDLKKYMFGKKLSALENAKSANEAFEQYSTLQELNQQIKITPKQQKSLDEAYDKAAESFGAEFTHHEELYDLIYSVNDRHVQEFRNFSREVKNAKSSFRNSDEYNRFSAMADAYASLVGEVNRAKMAGEEQLNASNLSSNAKKISQGILRHQGEITMEDAGRLVAKFSAALMDSAKAYEKYKMGDHTLDPEKEPNKKLLNKDDLRKLNLINKVLGKPQLPKDPKDLYKQKDAKVQQQSVLM